MKPQKGKFYVVANRDGINKNRVERAVNHPVLQVWWLAPQRTGDHSLELLFVFVYQINFWHAPKFVLQFDDMLETPFGDHELFLVTEGPLYVEHSPGVWELLK